MLSPSQTKVRIWVLLSAVVLCWAGVGRARVGAADDPVEKLLATTWNRIGEKLKGRKDPLQVELLVKGQTKLVDLIEMDASNCLIYKQFGQKTQLAATEATATQIAGILQVLVDEDSPSAALDHLYIGLLYDIEGKIMLSATEINKATTLDSALEKLAKEQLNILPRPHQPDSSAAQAAATAALMNGGGGGNSGGSYVYKPTPQGTNQEGRSLGIMPKITQAMLFNTPEADQVMASVQVFPKNNPWNEDISKLPVLAESDKIVEHIGSDKHIHFNHDMNFVIVPPTQAKIPLGKIEYQDESDPGPYPIPDNTPIEGWGFDDETLLKAQKGTGGDRHAVVVDPYNGLEFDFYQLSSGTGKWTAGCEATFDLKSNAMRPLRWTSSDAAGLPLLPSIVRFDECERGMVEHALRFTVRQSRPEYIYPARHVAATSHDKFAPAMGQRFRLKASVTVPGLSKHAQAVLLGLKKYGMFMADNGSDWYISSTPDKRVTGLEGLHVLKGSDFEVVQTTPETGAAGR